MIRTQSDQYHDYRGYAGTVAGGVFRTGDEVTVLPSGFSSTSKASKRSTVVDEAFSPMAGTIRINDEIDISRGDMIVRPNNQPTVAQDIDAMVCWMNERISLQPGSKLVIKHTTRSTKILVKELSYLLDINTLHRDESATQLSLNEIGRVRLRSQVPLFFDE